MSESYTCYCGHEYLDHCKRMPTPVGPCDGPVGPCNECDCSHYAQDDKPRGTCRVPSCTDTGGTKHELNLVLVCDGHLEKLRRMS